MVQETGQTLWHPYNEELRRKALLATLNAILHEPDQTAIGHCALDWIEDLQESIGCPMGAQQTLALYRACLQAGIEPDYETWCQPEQGSLEDIAVAATRLRLQQENSEEFSTAAELLENAEAS